MPHRTVDNDYESTWGAVLCKCLLLFLLPPGQSLPYRTPLKIGKWISLCGSEPFCNSIHNTVSIYIPRLERKNAFWMMSKFLCWHLIKMCSKPGAFWNAKKNIGHLLVKKSEIKNVYVPQYFLTELEVSALKWCYFVVFQFWGKWNQKT